MASLATLDPGRELLARRPFRFAGRDFAAGDPFPWRDVRCSDDQLRRLFDARMVRHDAQQDERFPGDGWVVQKPMTFDGRPFDRGDAFPWRALGCPSHRLRQLIDNRWIGFVADDRPTVTPTGRGWFVVSWRGEDKRIRGEAEAEAYAAGLMEQ